MKYYGIRLNSNSGKLKPRNLFRYAVKNAYWYDFPLYFMLPALAYYFFYLVHNFLLTFSSDLLTLSLLKIKFFILKVLNFMPS